ARLDGCAAHYPCRSHNQCRGAFAGGPREHEIMMDAVSGVAMAEAGTGALRTKMETRELNFFYGESRALKSVTLPLYENKVTAIIGPSGCGKSTLLRIFNRIYELYPRQRAEGEVRLGEENILDGA